MSFEDKKKALFASLETAEKSIASSSVLHQDQDVDYNRRRRSDDRLERSSSNRNRTSQDAVKKFRGRESIFKRPAAPIGKCLPTSRVPDFKKNPQKWTKYSLEDVDISDRSNTAAAFSFLREIESQKREQEQDAEEDGPSGAPSQFRAAKVRFNRSIKLKSELEDKPLPPEEGEKPMLKGRKVVMPEYVVGQKAIKSKPARVAGGGSSKKDRNSKELKLDHLMEDEEDEEDDDDGME